MAVRVRFAPSPTGYLHIGGLRTALFCYLFARRMGGTFVLRIEDTDRARFVADAEDDITAGLAWAGLDPDEGPHLGPGYRQSERTALYRSIAQRLLRSGHAYAAFDTPEALQAMRDRGETYSGATRRAMCNAFTLPQAEVEQRLAAGTPHVVRLHVPEDGEVTFTDIVKGPVTFAADSLDDQILLKSDGQPTYHLANVVDDHAMGITHVIRGEEWLSSAPKHMLLYQALGWEPPRMAHLPLILSPGGGKLSKRSATRLGIPVNVRDYQSYEPEAVINFLALLGWHPSTEQEVFTLDELKATFSLERVAPSPARFDLDKLRWFNQKHLIQLGTARVAARVRSELESALGPIDPAYLHRVLVVVGERLMRRQDLFTRFAYFFQDPESYDPRGVKKRWKADAKDLVLAYADALEALAWPEADAQSPATDLKGAEGALEHALRNLAAMRGIGAGRIIHPVRLATSGTTAGPSLFAMLAVLGRERCVRRLRRAAAVLGP